MTFKSLFSALKAPRQPTEKELVSDVAPAAPPLMEVQATGTVRRPAASTAVTISPEKAARVLRGVNAGVPLVEYVETGMAMLRRSPKLRSAMSTRVLAVTGLHKQVESSGTSRLDKKALLACQELVKTPHFQRLVRHLAWASYIGWQGAQIIYEKGPYFWPITDFKQTPAHWFMFDSADGETPLLLPETAGGRPTPLEPARKFVFHAPALLPGAVATSGLMFTALHFACLLDVIQGRGNLFVELFGMPMRLGKYPAGSGPEYEKNLKVMRRALEELGSDAWAMIPESMQIEFLKDATVQGSIEVYEKWSRYFDELLTQLVLGGSLTSGTGQSGSGAGKALGVVHNELRADIMTADATDICVTIMRDVFTPFVHANFGENVVVPTFCMKVLEAEDVQAKGTLMQGFMDRGVKFLTSDVHSMLNTTEPQDGDDTVGGSTPSESAPAGAPGDDAKAANSLRVRFAATPASGQGTGGPGAALDELDALEAELLADDGYVAADDAINAELLALVVAAAAEGPDAVNKAVLSFIEKSNVGGLRAVFTAGMTAARAAGDLGLELTDADA